MTTKAPAKRPRGKDRKTDTLDTLDTLSGQTPNQRRNTRRAERRLASRTAQVTVWWSKLVKPRPVSFRPEALAQSLGQSMRRMAGALRWLGWLRIERRIKGKATALWLPPESPVKPRKRGGPRTYPCD